MRRSSAFGRDEQPGAGRPRSRLRIRLLRSWCLLAAIAALAAGCGASVFHVVQPGETLYSISFRYGKDYHRMAQWNNIQEPYTLSPGQHIRIIPPRQDAFALPDRSAGARHAPPVARAAPEEGQVPAPQSSVEVYGLGAAPKAAATPPAPETPVANEPAAAATTAWQWPTTHVPARSALTVSASSKGIDIAGSRGEAVLSTAAGRVVYSGSGIPHYGNLLIVKHDEHFLSAYAHNDRLLVGEGEWVSAGQQIAEMGDSGTGTNAVKLHFEIREDGVPVDPLQYLPKPPG